MIALDIPSLVTLYLGRKCFGNIQSDISIDNFNKLTQLEIEDTAFQMADSLKICNNDKLEKIQIICDHNRPQQTQGVFSNHYGYGKNNQLFTAASPVRYSNQSNSTYPPTVKHVVIDST